MFNKIIVGVDGRQGGRDALALAARLASFFDGELVAVHAYPYDFFTVRGTTPEFETIMHGTAEDLLMGELERTHVVAHAAAMPDGSPGRALHLAAKRHHADLIVVGSAHRGLIGRVLAGDVTDGDPARCPVPRHRRRRAASPNVICRCRRSASASTARPSRAPPSSSRTRDRGGCGRAVA